MMRTIVGRVFGYDPHIAAAATGILTVPTVIALNGMLDEPLLVGNDVFLAALIVSWIAYAIVYRQRQ